MVIDISLMEKFIHLLMIAGKKDKAHKIFFAAGSQFLQLTKKEKNDPAHPLKRHWRKKNRVMDLLNKRRFLKQMQTVIRNVQPSLEGKKCRIAGTTKLVPAVITQKRGSALAMRWIIKSARNRKRTNKSPFYQCLAQELLDAYQGQGEPRLRREQFHKLCEGNRGYLRYRWW